MKQFQIILSGGLVALALFACTKEPPVSTEDPLPLPSGMEASKDLSVKPGDSFYDYCNGTWLRQTAIPASGTVGGLYEQEPAMEQRVEQLKASVPDIRHFYELMDAVSGNPEATKAYLDAQKARFPKPQTKEEAFEIMGRMMADGVSMWPTRIVPTYNLVWKDGRMMGLIYPLIEELPGLPDTSTELDPAQLVPLVATKAGGAASAPSLIVKGMGQDPSLFVTDPKFETYWAEMEARPLEELSGLIDEAWAFYEKYGAGELNNMLRLDARMALNYTLSYHFTQAFLSPAFKEKFLGITKEIQAALRKRIQQVDWMSEATRNNALDKLDACGLFVAYPDQWYMDGVVSLTDCTTLAEAVHRCDRGTTILKNHLLGGQDAFSYQITLSQLGLSAADLTFVNASYSASNNAIFIYPALLLPPFLPENVSQAYEYAVFSSIGHELTHGFDTMGSQYDKFGNKRNWWTVADKMAFEERRDKLIDCYDHLEIDPLRAPGTYSDGTGTIMENIADLGGFLTALDAYKARLEADGYCGETYKAQLRKFFESHADIWKVQYSDAKLSTFPKMDTHSHARLRVNGVDMNTDLWYELYNVDRNCILYLPPERRTYIW
jgi:predicted metalloendopeptidase